MLGMDADFIKSLRVVLQTARNPACVAAMLLENNIITDADIREAGIRTDARVMVYRLRKKLLRHGIELRCTYGDGYWMDSEDKTKLRALVEEL